MTKPMSNEPHDENKICAVKEIIRYTIDKKLIRKVVGKNIRALREKAGLTQKELSEMCDISRASVVNIEQGRQNIVPVQIYSFAFSLKCRITEILPEMENPNV